MKTKKSFYINKFSILIFFGSIFCAAIIIKLFSLQIIQHQKYSELAAKEHYGIIELNAQRGEILIQDFHSNEEFLLATNITLNLIYADPVLIEDPLFVGEKLSPLLFDLEEAREEDEERIEKLRNDTYNKLLNEEITEEEAEEILNPKTDLELENNFKKDLIEKLSEKQRTEILLYTELTPTQKEEIRKKNLNGFEIINDQLYAYPPQISNTDSAAQILQNIIDIPALKLAQILKGENRYIILKKKLAPEISKEILEIQKEFPEEFKGIAMNKEFFRYYPEGNLAANIIGYTNKENTGQYGIESTFDTELKGISGKFQTKKDSIGRQITTGESILEHAVDGDDILLTLDRSIQAKTDEIIKNAVNKYQADSGQAIIMNPQTGEVLAISHYPSFDPNSYGDVFNLKEIYLNEEELDALVETNEEDTYKFYTNLITKDYYLVFKKDDKEGNTHFYRYENYVGPEVYHNKAVSWPYEPGSVFKTIAMAIGIDDHDITENTTYNDEGPVEVDYNQYTGEYDFEIKNSHGYLGLVDMKTVLGESLNTGMTFVAKQIGPALFYDYLDKFGFLDKTGIEFASESNGKIDFWEDWTESELATHSFGQGITVTMIQVANAYSSIINGGILLKPYIISEIRHDDGKTIKYEKTELRRVVSEETSNIMKNMLVNSVENGVAYTAQVDEHFVGGKTGTSQTYRNGKALSGVGTTIASFAGFGPIDDPQFVILVKLDRPKTSEWGSTTAAPTFVEIADFLFNYYNISPDKNISI